MINDVRYKIIAGKKLTKFPNFTRFLPKNARLHNNTTRSRPAQVQMFEAEAEAEAKDSRPRPIRLKFWPRGHFGLDDLTSLHTQRRYW